MKAWYHIIFQDPKIRTRNSLGEGMGGRGRGCMSGFFLAQGSQLICKSKNCWGQRISPGHDKCWSGLLTCWQWWNLSGHPDDPNLGITYMVQGAKCLQRPQPLTSSKSRTCLSNKPHSVPLLSQIGTEMVHGLSALKDVHFFFNLLP